ncbi:MAG: response regulator [Clostridia bacterium]|nr:response regulator [Clostridia bacterium]
MKYELKAVIADDEFIILKGLRNILDWDQLGIEIIGEATNGEELYNLISEYKPDIVISDISMPKMSGLEVLKAVREKKIETNFVFISGYQDFEFVRESLVLGAEDYLLKPINEDMLYDIVLKICNKALGKRNSDNEFGLISDDLQSFSVLIFDTGQAELSEVYEYLSENDFDVIKYHNHICKIYMIDGSRGIDSIISDADSILKELVEKFDVKMDGAVGRTVKGTKKIVDSYNDALTALQYGYFFEESKIYSKKDIKLFRNNSKENMRDILDDLIDKIKSLNETSVSEYFETVFEYIRKDSMGVKDIAVMKLFSAEEHIRHTIKHNALDRIISESDMLMGMKDSESYKEACEFMKDIILQFIRSIASNKKDRNSFEIEKVKEFIESNISENIKLEDAARIVYMNTYYFSVYFKKHAGINFKDYVMKLKMEKAYSMIQNTDLKIYEIADAVGFCDQKHFSNVFKKYFGLSATDLRKE